MNAWAPETSETEPQIFPIRAQITPRRGEVDQKITAGAKNVAHFVLGAVLELSWKRSGSSWAHHGSQLGAKRPPNGSPQGLETELEKNSSSKSPNLQTSTQHTAHRFCGFFLEQRFIQNLILELLEVPLSQPGALGCFLRALGGILELFWRLLERFWAAGGSTGKLRESSGRGGPARLLLTRGQTPGGGGK